MIRAFIAFELPPEVKTYLGEIISGLRGNRAPVRWVKPEGLHITLKFLGDIEEKIVPSLSRQLNDIVASCLPLQLSLSHLGAFPDARRPRVIWAGLRGDTSAMAEIAGKIDRICTSFGMEKEKRPFRAHVTIGRLKVPSVVDLAQELRDTGFTIQNVILYQSELSSQGARYFVMNRSVLGQKKGE
jgi:2'-5' RNA ligase